jgi:Flp pilus assembly protein TadD
MSFDPNQAMQQAVQLQQAGRLIDAEKIARQILAVCPDHDGAVHLLGVIARVTRNTEPAIELFRRAIAINPHVAGYYNNLGNALTDKGLRDEALSAYRNAIQIDPGFALAYYNVGETLIGMNRFELLDEAIAATREAIRLMPGHVESQSNLSVALRKQEKFDQAIDACRGALAINPNHAAAFNNLGNALKERGDFRQSIAAYKEAIRCQSDFDTAHYNLGMVSLLIGDFSLGWKEYEWRLKNNAVWPKDVPQIRWGGEQLAGKRILLWGEQGMGDIIQLVRYVPLVAELGGRTVVKCYPALVRVLRGDPRLGQVLAMEDPLPPCDVECPIVSLPMVFKTKLESIPASVPYLTPESALREAWKRKLSPSGGDLRVGLVWAGNPNFRDDRTRSLRLEQLAQFGAVRNVQFYSLQKGPPGEQAKNPPPGLNLIDLGPQLDDFADTAAVMSLMDLIITTDTSIPHLAGALGRPVWLMLQFVPDFRWLLDRDDSPWYPTMRLFRQKTRGDWPGVIGRVTEALVELRDRRSAKGRT